MFSEIVHDVVFDDKKIPLEAVPGFRKLYMLLLVIIFPLFSFPEVPRENIAFMGRADAFAVILLSDIRLLSFPVPHDEVEKKIIPPATSVSDPFIVQYCTMLFTADSRKSIVEAEVLVFEFAMIRSAEPVRFTLPSIITFEAPERSINGPLIFPLRVSPVDAGYIVMEL